MIYFDNKNELIIPSFSIQKNTINIWLLSINSPLRETSNMFLTNVLLKKTKSKFVMVLMESVVSGHQFNKIRERLADKLEVIRFDPYIQHESLYKEKKKIRSLK